MTEFLHIIVFSLAFLLGCFVLAIVFINLKYKQIDEGVIIDKHVNKEHEVTEVYIIGDIPVSSKKMIPAKYYFDICGYDKNNKMRTITINVTEEIYNQYIIGDTWRSDANDQIK